MSDESSSVQASDPVEPTPGAVLTAGGLIRQAREASGLHIAALAVSLKVPVKKLEALEADRLDALHDAVFVRALASSVCRTLRIDPSLVLDKLPQGAAPVLLPGSGINAAFQTSANPKGLALGVRLRHPWVLAVLALLLAAAVVAFLPELEKVAVGSSVTHPALPVAAPAVPVTASPPEAPGMPASAADIPAGTVLENVLREPASSASAAAAVVAINRAASQPTPVAPVPLESNAFASAVLAFKAKAETWIEVTDAHGTVVLRRTLMAGETAAASGALPLKSVVGRADALEVQVRGKPFDLGPVSKDNVARFEVKQ